MTQNNFYSLRGFTTHLPDSSAMRRTAAHPSHYINGCIGYQSSIALSKNSLLYAAIRLLQQPSYTWSNTSIIINLLDLCVCQTLRCIPYDINQNRRASRACFLLNAPTVYGTVCMPSAITATSSQHQFQRQLKRHLFQRVFIWLTMATSGASVSSSLSDFEFTAPLDTNTVIDWLIDCCTRFQTKSSVAAANHKRFFPRVSPCVWCVFFRWITTVWDWPWWLQSVSKMAAANRKYTLCA